MRARLDKKSNKKICLYIYIHMCVRMFYLYINKKLHVQVEKVYFEYIT